MSNSDDGLTWVTGDPLNSEPRNLGAQEIRGLRKGVALRIDKEHRALTIMSNGGPDLSTGGGEHISGSAMVYHQEDAPTLRPDGETTLTSADNGRLWLRISTGVMSSYAHPSWIGVTPSALTVDDDLATAITSSGGWTNDTGDLALVIMELKFVAVPSRILEVGGARIAKGVVIGSVRIFGGSVFVPNASTLEIIPNGSAIDGTNARYQRITVT